MSGSTVYAGGGFINIGSAPRSYLAALNAAGGATSWNPNPDQQVTSLLVRGSTVIAGGSFTHIGGQARNRLAAIDVSNGLATSWNPRANGEVYALASSGSTVFAGGIFTNVGGSVRSRIAALDVTTGLATAWNPNANGDIRALAVSGNTVYAGGNFTNIGGQARNHIAALDSTSGLATGWNPNADFIVYTMGLLGNTVYLGGDFTNVGGQARQRIAAVDATSGLATGWAPNANGTVYGLALRGTTVYAAGTFTMIGGQARNRIAAIDAISGTANGWNPNANSTVYSLALSDSTIYAGGNFTTIGGQTRRRLAALGAVSGLATAWDPNVDSFVEALAVSGTTVYAGGTFTNAGGQTRPHIVALDATTNTNNATAWNPTPDSDVQAIVVSGPIVHAGGLFTRIAGTHHSGVAALAAQPVVRSTLPANGGNAGQVTVKVSGSGLPSGATIRLTRSGQPDIAGTSITVTPDGTKLLTVFDLTGAQVGLWNVVVTTPDNQTATLTNGFTIAAVEAPQLRVFIVCPTLIRRDHITAFDLVVENAGNIDAVGVPLWVAGIPASASVAMGSGLAYPPQDPGEPDWSQVPLTFTSASGNRYLAMVIPRVPPGTLSRRVVLSVPASVSSFNLVAAVTPPWVDGTTFRSCLVDGGVIGNPACMGGQLTSITAYLAVHPEIDAVSGAAIWAKDAWQCEGSGSLAAAVAKSEQVMDYLVQPVDQLGSVASSCGEVLNPRWREAFIVGVVGSIDPNDKLGAHGTQSGQQALPYSIRFENLSNASAPAQQVQVNDTIDPATLDANTLSLDAMTFGNIRVVPPPGRSSYATTVDLRPAKNLLVNVNVSLDPITKVLSWFFSSIDPNTGQPPTNPLVGFLPANVTPPEGEGSVLFTVMPKAGIASGTQIANRASIIFDDPPGMDTPNWTNLVDNTPPQSNVLAIGASAQDSAAFTVRWQAVGSPADLRDFTIYASQDGGPYWVWRLNTVATADTFKVVANHYQHTYSFYSVARDVNGNIETAPGGSDASTNSRVDVDEHGGPTLALALEGARPNPVVGAMRVRLTLPSREKATLELIDVAGRRLLRRDVESLGPGRHEVVLDGATRPRAGLYFLKLAQGGSVVRARCVVIE